MLNNTKSQFILPMMFALLLSASGAYGLAPG